MLLLARRQGLRPALTNEPLGFTPRRPASGRPFNLPCTLFVRTGTPGPNPLTPRRLTLPLRSRRIGPTDFSQEHFRLPPRERKEDFRAPRRFHRQVPLWRALPSAALLAIRSLGNDAFRCGSLNPPLGFPPAEKPKLSDSQSTRNRLTISCSMSRSAGTPASAGPQRLSTPSGAGPGGPAQPGSHRTRSRATNPT